MTTSCATPILNAVHYHCKICGEACNGPYRFADHYTVSHTLALHPIFDTADPFKVGYRFKCLECERLQSGYWASYQHGLQSHCTVIPPVIPSK